MVFTAYRRGITHHCATVNDASVRLVLKEDSLQYHREFKTINSMNKYSSKHKIRNMLKEA